MKENYMSKNEIVIMPSKILTIIAILAKLTEITNAGIKTNEGVLK